MTTAERNRRDEWIVEQFKMGYNVEEIGRKECIKNRAVENIIRRWMKRYPEGRKA